MAQPLIQVFHSLISASIGPSGIYPHAGVSRTGNDLRIIAMDYSPQQVLAFAIDATRNGSVDEIIVGLDRYTRPHQGTKLGDLISGCWWLRERGWQCGIIEYQHRPRIVMPWDWDNFFWTGIMARELEKLGVHSIATAQ